MKAICQECMKLIDTRGMKMHKQSKRCVSYRTDGEVSLERTTTPEDEIRHSKYSDSESDYQRKMSSLLAGRSPDFITKLQNHFTSSKKETKT